MHSVRTSDTCHDLLCGVAFVTCQEQVRADKDLEFRCVGAGAAGADRDRSEMVRASELFSQRFLLMSCISQDCRYHGSPSGRVSGLEEGLVGDRGGVPLLLCLSAIRTYGSCVVGGGSVALAFGDYGARLRLATPREPLEGVRVYRCIVCVCVSCVRGRAFGSGTCSAESSSSAPAKRVGVESSEE